MEDRDKLKALGMKLALVAFLGLVGTIGGCKVHADYQVTALIKQGTNPIAARCAIYGRSGSVTCYEFARLPAPEQAP